VPSSRPLRGVLLLLLRHAHIDAALQPATLGGHPLLLRLLQTLQAELGSISWLVPALAGASAAGAAAATDDDERGDAAGAGSGETALERYLLGSVVPLLLCAYGGALAPADEQEAGGDLMAIVEARAAARVASAAAAAAEEEAVGLASLRAEGLPLLARVAASDRVRLRPQWAALRAQLASFAPPATGGAAALYAALATAPPTARPAAPPAAPPALRLTATLAQLAAEVGHARSQLDLDGGGGGKGEEGGGGGDVRRLAPARAVSPWAAAAQQLSARAGGPAVAPVAARLVAHVAAQWRERGAAREGGESLAFALRLLGELASTPSAAAAAAAAAITAGAPALCLRLVADLDAEAGVAVEACNLCRVLVASPAAPPPSPPAGAGAPALDAAAADADPRWPTAALLPFLLRGADRLQVHTPAPRLYMSSRVRVIGLWLPGHTRAPPRTRLHSTCTCDMCVCGDTLTCICSASPMRCACTRSTARRRAAARWGGWRQRTRVARAPLRRPPPWSASSVRCAARRARAARHSPHGCAIRSRRRRRRCVPSSTRSSRCSRRSHRDTTVRPS